VRLFYLTLVVALIGATELKAETILLGTGVNSDPPYVIGDFKIDEDTPGITIELLQLIEQKLNIEFQISMKPWARVIEEIKNNQLHGGFHFSYLKERKSFVSYPILPNQKVPDSAFSLSTRSDVLYQLKGNNVSWNGAKFVLQNERPARVGVIRGGAILFDLALNKSEVVEVNNDQQLLNLLLTKRVDGIIGLSSMLDPKLLTLEDSIQQQIEKVTPSLTTKHFYIAFSKQFEKENAELVWKIWNAIKQLKENGTFQKLERKYAQTIQ